jgi:hypothetical protein
MSKDDSEIVRLAGQHVFDLFRKAFFTIVILRQ